MVDAWDGAIASAADKAGVGRTALQTRLNATGTAYRDVIKGCKQARPTL